MKTITAQTETKLQCPDPDCRCATGYFCLQNKGGMVIRCEDCGLHYTHSSKSNNDCQHVSLSESNRLYKVARWFALRWKARLLSKHVKPVNDVVLDIGCGTGEFVKMLAKKDIFAMGVDADKRCLDYAQNFGRDVQEHIDWMGGFDAITMWHSLEHFDNPFAMLRQAHDMLFPGGVIFITVPNYDSSDAEHYGDAWAALDMPRHRVHFTAMRLCNVIRNTGFEILETRQMPFDPFFNCMASMPDKWWMKAVGLIHGLLFYITGRQQPLLASSVLVVGRKK